MKKGLLMTEKILLVLTFIIFLTMFLILYVYGRTIMPSGKPVAVPPPSPLTVDEIEKLKK